MIPKHCCRTCKNFGIDFKLDCFCYKYEDYEIDCDCEEYKNSVPITTNGKWINDGDCMITSCCNKAYDINKFAETRNSIWLPKVCPNCGAKMDLKEG